MKGKWAEGIQPRNFAWVIKDRLAVSERPGGYGASHRRVRRQEEIIWIRRQGFDVVVSLIPSPHNLHNYDELGQEYLHRPWPAADHLAGYTASLYEEIQGLLDSSQTVLVHQEQVGDRVCGLMAGYLLTAGLVPGGPEAITIVERIFERRLGPEGRAVVEMALTARA